MGLKSWAQKGAQKGPAPPAAEGREPGRNREASAFSWFNHPPVTAEQGLGSPTAQDEEKRKQYTSKAGGKRRTSLRGCGFLSLHAPSVTPCGCSGQPSLTTDMLFQKSLPLPHHFPEAPPSRLLGPPSCSLPLTLRAMPSALTPPPHPSSLCLCEAAQLSPL